MAPRSPGSALLRIATILCLTACLATPMAPARPFVAHDLILQPGEIGEGFRVQYDRPRRVDGQGEDVEIVWRHGMTSEGATQTVTRLRSSEEAAGSIEPYWRPPNRISLSGLNDGTLRFRRVEYLAYPDEYGISCLVTAQREEYILELRLAIAPGGVLTLTDCPRLMGIIDARLDGLLSGPKR